MPVGYFVDVAIWVHALFKVEILSSNTYCPEIFNNWKEIPVHNDNIILEELTDQELNTVNGAGYCENMKGRVEGSEWPPAGLLETFWYYRKCK